MIVVGGEALVDLVDEQGELRSVPGGGPFNTAIALGRLGIPVAYLGTLSNDEYGGVLAESLFEAGADMSLVRWSDAPTPLAVVHRHDDGGNTYTFRLANTSFTDLPPESVPALPEDVRAIHVGTLGLAIDPPAAAYEALLEREAGRRTIVLDPNVRPAVFGDPSSYRARFERIAGLATIVKLSEDDAAWIYPELELADVLDHIRALGPRLVAVTMGTDGAVAASADGHVRVPAVPVAVADTVGAGDSFGAALLAALAERDALELEAARPLDDSLLEGAVTYAVTAAAITCTRTGAVPPSRAEIDAWLTVERGAPGELDGPEDPGVIPECR
ncbi:MAG TPA: carbohydrate kinase [Gaiellaceae bacterium]|nr:carbohydrate kinase [Gaiellaceae bacterium]